MRIVFVVMRHSLLSHENIIVVLVVKHFVQHVHRNNVHYLNTVLMMMFAFVFLVTNEFKRMCTKRNMFENIEFLFRTGSVRQQKPIDPIEFDEDKDLQLAISLSQREAEEKEYQKKLFTQQYAKTTIEYPPIPIGSAPMPEENYWETQTKQDLITIKPLPNVRKIHKQNQMTKDTNCSFEYRIHLIPMYATMKSIVSFEQ